MGVSIMWERCGFLAFLTISLIYAKYQQIILILALVTFFGIYSLYLYNFLRHLLETDCKKLDATTDGVEKIYLSSTGQKEIMKDERRKLMEKFKEDLVLVERVRVLEEEKEMSRKLEQKKILDLEGKCSTLEEEKRHFVNELTERQEKVTILEDHCVKLAEENRRLAEEIEDLANELSGEKQKMSGLEVKYATLGKELEEERDAKQSFRVASELVEMLKAKLLEIHDVNEQVKKVEDESKKLAKKKRKLEKKFKKLEEEKKDWVAERENLLVVVDSQASLVQTYKDVLDKEECLMKLLDVKNSYPSSGLA